jgi:hypothetical protein
VKATTSWHHASLATRTADEFESAFVVIAVV